MDNLNELAELHQTMVSQLEALTGSVWQNVKSEFHAAYGEMPIWIQLYKGSELSHVHEAFCQIAVPIMEQIRPIELTVTYVVITEIFEITVETLMDNSEILDAAETQEIGAFPDTSARDLDGMFGRDVSIDRPV